MLRFLRSHIHPTGELKTADVHDFFDYSSNLRHGFPQMVSSLAHDYLLGLMAIGTKDGDVRIFGAENVEWNSVTPGGVAVAHMYFAAGLGTLIVLCADQSFHRFQVLGASLKCTTANNEERLKRITSCEMQNVREPVDARLFIGTITGNVFGLHVSTLEYSEVILFEDSIAKSVNIVKDDAKSADLLVINPSDITTLLIAYNYRVIVWYNLQSNEVVRFWSMHQSITSMAWHISDERLVCSFADGSLETWRMQDAEPDEPSFIPFGPFPCTPISKVRWVLAVSHPQAIRFFTGGMPRASYGDRYTLTAMRDGKMVVFDFGSPVVDFFLVPTLCNKEADFSKCIALMVLCEEELVCIDLTEKSWPLISLPYLHSIHSSPITCNVHCSSVEEHVWKLLMKATEARKKADSKSSWPIHAGANAQVPAPPCAATNAEKRQLLITGHEDGTVKFWSTGSISLHYLLTVNTAREFEGYLCEDAEALNTTDGRKRNSSRTSGATSDEDSNEITDWPPFRKVGMYDPFCDDPRLAIQKVHFDIASGQLVVGGRSGQCIVYDLEDEHSDPLTVSLCNYEMENRARLLASKMQQPLPPRHFPVVYPIGYQPYKIDRSRSFIAQLLPPVPVTAVASLRSRNLLAFGCEYGFVVCDLKSQATLISKCLLTYNDMATAEANTGALSRFKSMKKSIRQSFRRKKKVPQDIGGRTEPGCSTNPDLDEIRPVERHVISRTDAPLNIGDPLSSAVRVLSFFHTNILSNASRTDSLWVGTNRGVIYAYAISDDALKPEDVCVLVKEIRLQHRAPVIEFTCAALDGSQLIKGLTGAERLIVYTEEQIKTFALPTMRPTRFRYKLTGIEGSRIRKAQLLTLRSATNRKIYDRFIVVVTNQGELFVFLALTIKQCLKVNFTQAADVAGIASAVISGHGELFFLRPGASEFQRASLAAVQHNNLISPLKDSDLQQSPFPMP